ncbi:AarF/UbiB family protein [Bremerella sp. JC770]|uniref:ABC1 kinase family protein n=1 Tax=Bremerella sp. JC770 TaxID=3232137 RepID=UPI003459320E
MPVETIRRTWNYAQLAKDSAKARWTHDAQAKRAAQKMVAQRLGKMRGLPQKVGQMMAFSADASKQEAFGDLYESADPLPWSTMRPILAAAWDVDPDTLFNEVDPHGKAASLGQVHAATLPDGRKLAIKIQYPGIHDAVMSDLAALGWLSKPLGDLSGGFDLEGYRHTILEGLKTELDYRLEASSQAAFAAGPGQNPWVMVPEVDQELSCENVLVSQWIDGDSWQNVQASWSSQEKAELGRRLLFWFLESLFEHGQLHADMHPGNVRFVRTADGPKIVLYDFGSVYHMSQQERLTLLRFIQATRDQSEAPLPYLVALGFRQDLLEPLDSRLPALCRVLLEPFCVDHPYDTRQWQLSERLNDLLGNERMNFRIAGPPQLIYLLRSFHAMITYLSGLDAKVLWCRGLQTHVAKYRQAMGLLKLPTLATVDYQTLARHLKVQVLRDGQLKASVTLAAAAIDRLENFLDDETLERIGQERIDLTEIVRDVRRQGYVPGNVFELKDPHREVKVWLE